MSDRIECPFCGKVLNRRLDVGAHICYRICMRIGLKELRQIAHWKADSERFQHMIENHGVTDHDGSKEKEPWGYVWMNEDGEVDTETGNTPREVIDKAIHGGL